MFYEKPEMDVIVLENEEVMTLEVSEETDGGEGFNPWG